MTIIKQLDNVTFDVFYGDKGWDDWARFQVVDNRLHVVTCPKQLPAHVMNEVRNRLTTKPRLFRRGH